MNESYYERNKERLKKKSREWYKNNKEKVAQQKKDNYVKNKPEILIDRKTYAEKNPIKMLLAHAKSRSKYRGHEFSLSEEDIVIPTHCPYLGVSLTNIQGNGHVDTNISLDRKDPAKGYVSGNVQVISRLANRMKNSATVEELQAFAINILKLHPL